MSPSLPQIGGKDALLMYHAIKEFEPTLAVCMMPSTHDACITSTHFITHKTNHISFYGNGSVYMSVMYGGLTVI